jgi:hypothetical protein
MATTVPMRRDTTRVGNAASDETRLWWVRLAAGLLLLLPLTVLPQARTALSHGLLHLISAFSLRAAAATAAHTEEPLR